MALARREEGESALQMNAPQAAASDLPPSKSLDETVLCLRIRYWWFLTLFNQVFLVILLVSCLATPKWVKQGDYGYEWEGGVIACTTCEYLRCSGCGSFDNQLYSSLKDDGQCGASLVAESFCSAFEDLSAAGGVYFFFEIFSFLALFAWIVRVVFLLYGKDCCTRMRWLGFLYPGLALLFHFLGLIIWAGISEAKFDGDCQNDQFDGSKPTLCATNGPALAVFTVVFYAIAVGLFAFSLVKSGPSSPQKAEEPAVPPPASDLPLHPSLPLNSSSPRRFSPMQIDDGAGAQLPGQEFPLDNRA